MGSYDLHANNVVNFTLINCRMNHICDRTRWGVIASNFCKNILLEDCTLSRMDTHMGVSGTYTIRRCTLGHMGLNAIGRGLLTVEDSTLYGRRPGQFPQRLWQHLGGRPRHPQLPLDSGLRRHDLAAHDRRAQRRHARFRLSLLHAPGDHHRRAVRRRHAIIPKTTRACTSSPIRTTCTLVTKVVAPTAERPFPYERCQKVRVRGLTTASGKKPQVSPNAEMQKSIVVVEAT